MILLETNLGDYLVHNAVRLDFYKKKANGNFDTVLDVDSYTHVLHAFADESDANLFLELVREEILSLLCDWDHDNWTMANLNEICSDAMRQVIEGVKE